MNQISASQRFLYLFLGAFFTFFANGQYVFALAAWLSPVFMIRFMRAEKPKKAAWISILVSVLTALITFDGVIPMPAPDKQITLIMIGIFGILPLIIDRWLSPKLNNFAATLIFPSIWVGFEYLNSFSSPFGTWGVVAYSQFNLLPLVQLVSITGIWGLSFLVTWFGAVVNWAWEQGFIWEKIQKGAIIYGGILILVLGFGSFRLMTDTPKNLPVASLTVANDTLFALKKVFEGTILEEEKANLEKKMEIQHQKLFKKSTEAVEKGAKMIVWSEGNAVVFKDKEGILLETAQNFAKTNKIYLFMAVFSVTKGQILGENKVVIIDQEGKIFDQYLKSRPVPTENCVKGSGNIPSFQTEYGKVGTVICFDMDFPDFIRQTSEKQIEIMLVPANDWEAITPFHTQMAVFRAVENGFHLVRQTNHGLSIAADCYGRTLAEVNYFESSDPSLLTTLPSKGISTIYGKIGDAFAWFCIGIFLIMSGLAFRKPQATNQN